MKLKEKISIDEFDGKRFQIRLVEPVPTNEKKAVITHYLHNIDNGVFKISTTTPHTPSLSTLHPSVSFQVGPLSRGPT